MNERLADTRAGIDRLLQQVQGTHRPALSNRIAGLLVAALLVALSIALLATELSALNGLIAAISIAFGVFFIDEGFATLTIDANGITRRSLIRRWHIAVHEIAAIDLKTESDALLIRTVDDRTRAAVISGRAKDALTDVPEIGEISSQPAEVQQAVRNVYWHGTRRSLPVCAILAAIAIVTAYWHPDDPTLQTARDVVYKFSLSLAIGTGVMIVIQLLYIALMRFTPRQRMVIYLGVFVATLVTIVIAWKMGTA